MDSINLSLLLMESSRRYNKLSSDVFSFSVEQSLFASKIASQRDSLATSIITMNKNFEIIIDEEKINLLEDDNILSSWSNCINLDFALQDIFKEEQHILMHFQYVIEKSEKFINEIAAGVRKEVLYGCSVCGAVYTAKKAEPIVPCKICGAQENLQARLYL
ncbi:hypothetical protein [Desulfovibrio desulfuricans]|uniref:hypothetical protein n=1 Tax=Desulfovibrio desulfuricans TaxID=876 RepID=UPI00131D0A5F|nr:hypothetical protein [Desulfovibrio desulfuricans]